jgi:hypothetical protein
MKCLQNWRCWPARSRSPHPIHWLGISSRGNRGEWVAQIPTSELAHLLGLKALSGLELERYGFRLAKVGRSGIESAWKVEKLE